MKRYVRKDERAVEAADLRLLLIYVVRYALGRATSAPTMASRAVRLHADVLRDEDLRGMLSDVQSELRRTTFDATSEVRTWQQFADWCRGELAQRGEVQP